MKYLADFFDVGPGDIPRRGSGETAGFPIEPMKHSKSDVCLSYERKNKHHRLHLEKK